MSESLEKNLVESLIKDRRRDRIWKNIRFFIFIFLILLYTVILTSWGRDDHDSTKGKGYVSLVRLNGEIMAGKDFSAEEVIPLLNKAFSDPNAKGVVLDINSPGGSPVQASIIHDKIEQLKARYPKKKVVVMGGDTLASGAYLVATAADKIFVNRDTVTGSIGVIMSGFGFEDAIKKIGVTRRVFTAGDNKDRMDPFQAMRPQDLAKIKTVLNDVHQNFIQDVIQGRKGKLHGDPKELFSGDFWTGETAVKLGIADGTGNLWGVLKSQFGVQHYKDYSVRPSFFDVISKNIGTTLHFAFGADQKSNPVRAQLEY